MTCEQFVFDMVRTIVVAASFICVRIGLLSVRKHWKDIDDKKLSTGIMILWAGVMAGLIFLKMTGRGI